MRELKRGLEGAAEIMRQTPCIWNDACTKSKGASLRGAFTSLSHVRVANIDLRAMRYMRLRWVAWRSCIIQRKPISIAGNQKGVRGHGFLILWQNAFPNSVFG